LGWRHSAAEKYMSYPGKIRQDQRHTEQQYGHA
jgi:hypothetical protein